MTLLASLARQIGASAHAIALSRDLEASRQRIVLAREEERRRIRNDLHDGLGPSLAGITLLVGTARQANGVASEYQKSLLSSAEVQLQQCAQEVRRIVDDLRPPDLDELNLVEALQRRLAALDLSNSTTTISLYIRDEVQGIPADIEAAAYRVIMEAVTNVLRHADASACSVTLSVDDRLLIDVADNGRRVSPQLQPGVGLSSMRTRAAELGGTVNIDIGPRGGTTVHVELPTGTPTNE
jgi:signal transduction histidine kinase